MNKKEGILFMWLKKTLVLIIALGMLNFGCALAKEKADMILTNGTVLTIDAKDTKAEAVAVKDGRIIFVGTAAEAEKFKGDATKALDLSGKVLMPGMIDGHLHAPGTKLTELYRIDLNGILKEKETIETIAEYVKTNPDMEVYSGSGFSIGAFSGNEAAKGPRKERLDAISADKPIVLNSYDGHVTWLNSKAFEKFKITKDTAVPLGGVIEKDANGELWGTLKESAQNLVPEEQFTPEQNLKALKQFVKYMNSLGYTGIMSISGGSPVPFEDYKTLDAEGKLTLHVNASMTMAPEGEVAAQIEQAKTLRNTYSSGNIKLTTLKFFADGVIEGVTGYLLKPYEAAAGKGTDYLGEMQWDVKKMQDAFIAANKEGFQIHVHSIGDGATRLVLDGFDKAKTDAPAGDYRNVITHLQLVAPEDIQRFADLNVIAVPQPYWAFKEPEWWEVIDFPFLGDRAEKEYPIQSFIKAGVTLVGASDHPVTPTPNPFWAIEVGVTRNLENPEFYGVAEIANMDDPKWLSWPEERASVREMIKAYTINGAYELFRENEIGSIEVGKNADMIVVDKNILECNPLDIDSTKVLKTIFNGEIVYEAEQ